MASEAFNLAQDVQELIEKIQIRFQIRNLYLLVMSEHQRVIGSGNKHLNLFKAALERTCF